jgi:transposase
MTEFDELIAEYKVRRADHLPIVAAFCRKINLVNILNRLIPTKKNVDVGSTVLALILDTLSSRSPLYRLENFAANHDIGLLFGREIDSHSFNDTAVGRAMEVIHEYGTESLFSEVAFQAACSFEIDTRHVHFDTTSVNVWGSYKMCSKDKKGEGLQIVYGHSKDHRPDLKQFMIEMLCAGKNIPISGKCIDGNSSDKNVNNALLERISTHMARHGLQANAFIYIADSAMVTEENLHKVGDNYFITRLPFNYKEADKVVSEAVTKNIWTDIGALAAEKSTPARPTAKYRATETEVTLYGKTYRAVVVHSSAHDKRRQKKIDRQIEQSHKILTNVIKCAEKHEYACSEDAQRAAQRLCDSATKIHTIKTAVKNIIRYSKGRPPKNGKRQIVSENYCVKAEISEMKSYLDTKREEAGCFVLLTNVPTEGCELALDSKALLEAYKDQSGIERNFSFLKDPLIVNDIFLKNPKRIEVLGMILILSLMVWNIIEHTLRKYTRQTGYSLPGWDKKATYMPTSFMMSTKFSGIQTVTHAGNRAVAEKRNPTQSLYLSALGLNWDVFSDPHVFPKIK